MIAAAVRELGGSDVQDALARPLRDQVTDACEILVAVAEAHAPADAALKIAGTAAEEEGDHALVLVPDVDRAVQFRDCRSHGEAAEESVPESPELRKSSIHLQRTGKGLHHRPCRCLVDNGRRHELSLRRVLHIAQYKDKFLGGTGLQGDVEAGRRHRAPAVRYRLARCPGQHLLRGIEAVIQPDKTFPIRIEAVKRPVGAIEGIMVSALAILGLMVDSIRFHFHLSGREVALEVFHVSGSIPQAPLQKSVKMEKLANRTGVGNPDPVYFASMADGNEEKLVDPYAILLPRDAGITHAMAAFVEVQRSLAGLPTRTPDAIPVLDIEIAATGIHGHPVVTVAQDAAKFGVPAKTVAAGRIGNQGEEILRSHIIDPGPRGIGPGDHIFARSVVKMSEIVHVGKKNLLFNGIEA